MQLRIRQWIVILLGAVIAPSLLHAQNETGSVRVRAVDTNGEPVRGALAALIAPDGKVVVERLTDDSGLRILTALPGSYTVRIRRIGYEPFVSSPISVPYEGELKVAVSGAQVSLATVVVTAGSQCKHTEVDQRAIGQLWEEISKALLGAELARSDFKDLGWIKVYNKHVGAKGQLVSLDTSFSKVGDVRPFFASDPGILATRGFVRGNLTTGWEYFAPDERALLSPEFADTHCFSVVRDRKRSGQVGVSFEPSPGRKVGEIAGAIWLDEKSAELREIVFRYVNVGEAEQFKPGGIVHFRRLRSGALIVDDWKLTFPILRIIISDLAFERLMQDGYTENGGTIVQR